MTAFEKALINRDGISKEEAKRQREEATDAIYEALGSGASYDEVEDILASNYGLEMDYVLDLI